MQKNLSNLYTMKNISFKMCQTELGKIILFLLL